MKKRLLAAFMTVCVLATSAGIEASAAGEKIRNAEILTEEEMAGNAEIPLEGEATFREGNFNFAYLEYGNVELSEEQKILISAGENGSIIKNARLYYHRVGGRAVFWTEEKAISENAVLFSMEYTEETQKGIYVLDKMTYETEDGQKYEADLTEEKEMKFGFGEEAEATPDAYLPYEEPEVTAEIISMDGELQAVGSTQSAASNETAGIFIANEEAANAKAAGNMVIVLDPGHGGSDPGVVRTYNGVTYYERDLVLKIAEYCKAELETYEGVTVYLTRTDNTSTLMNRLERTTFALNKGANVIISLHINSTEDTNGTADGALVYCPNADTISGQISQALANKILETLAELGLRNRGISVDEGLGMILYPKQNGVPGILVEHCFMNNANDVSNYLSSDDKLKNLGEADAKAIANYYSLEKAKEYKKYEKDSGKITVKANTEKTTYTVTVGKVSEAYSVKYKIWNKSDSKSAIWYTATLKSNGNWKGSFQFSDFKKMGTYGVQAYVYNKDGSKIRVASTSFKVTGPSVEKIKVQSAKPKTGTFKIRIAGAKSDSPVTKVTVKAWSQSDKSDIHTYTAKVQTDGSYLASINIKNHDYNYGTYQCDVYIKDKNGITKRYKKSYAFERPSLDLTAAASSKQTTYTVKGNNILGMKSMKLAVWSREGGQDDLKWYTVQLGSDGTWSKKISIANHKTAGTYYVKVYGVKMNGKKTYLETIRFSVQAPVINEVAIKKIDTEAGTFQVYVKKITAISGVQSVKMEVWSETDESDMHTYKAKVRSDGSYRVIVNNENHQNNYGTYKIKIYVTDNRGVVGTKTIEQNFVTQ